MVPSSSSLAQPVHAFADAPVRDVITAVEQTTPYRFLYRDALISGRTVSFEAAPGAVLDSLARAVARYGLLLAVDSTRYQVLIVPAPQRERPSVLRGQVLDDEEGTRLPFATITWEAHGRLQGVVTDASGNFMLPLDGFGDQASVDVKASYVGYQTKVVRLSLAGAGRELPIRLSPKPLAGREVVVSSTLLGSNLDTTLHYVLRPDLYAPFGESSVLRSLQMLPSVSLTAAMSQGLNVRGSRSDGFQVLLDGVPIYSQHHFFGLFDAFNEDALQAVGLYYGVAPASYQAPPGGTVSFVTRTGSQTRHRQSIGLSNTALRGTAEGPLLDGRGSWLLSARQSYLDAVDWFSNSSLLAQGLNIVRETSTPPPASGRALVRAVPSDGGARFFDVHGKLFAETNGNTRITLGAYAGGDDTHQTAHRLAGAFGGGNGGNMMMTLADATTKNQWGNQALSFNVKHPFGARGYGSTLLAFSHYYSRFSKYDFTYVHPQAPQGMMQEGPIQELGAFNNHNGLREWIASQQLSFSPRRGGLVTAGVDFHAYSTSYTEDSILRTPFDQSRRSVQTDVFAQYDVSPTPAFALQAGARTQYYALGHFFRPSPRVQLTLFKDRPVALSYGFSRNHQFLHRLSIETNASSDVWVMSTASEPPGSVSHHTAGIYLRPTASFYLQVEGYQKHFENLRLHETEAARRGLVRETGVFFAPWIYDTRARARGLETMMRWNVGRVTWTQSYTLSRVELSHPRINGGEPFLASWDRTHQYSTRLQGRLGNGFSWHVDWLYASGAPNTLASTAPDEPPALDAYHRMDLGVSYRRVVGRATLETRFSLFNVYDRKNPWYRTPVPVIDASQGQRRPSFVNVDVYDLGTQPSFELRLSF